MKGINNPLIVPIVIYTGTKKWTVSENFSDTQKVEERYKKQGFHTNSALPSSQIEEYCKLGTSEKELMMNAFRGMELSGRGYHRVLKVARTIADLEGSVMIQEKHLCEALSYRSVEVR